MSLGTSNPLFSPSAAPSHGPHKLTRMAVSVLSSLALALMLVGARPAPARAGDAGALIFGAAAAAMIICSTTPNKCRGGGRRGGGGGGPADAIALDQQAKMDIQNGLNNVGFYNGAIDGAFGPGTRGSIRAYQGAIGASQTGVLTGAQINDLIALAPRYATLPANDARLFSATIAPDVDRDQTRMIQAELNGRGYNAGPVDGSWGGKTRRAVEAYMRDNFLPGPAVPSRRLLAHLQGTPAPEPAGAYMARVTAAPGAPGAPGMPVPATPTAMSQSAAPMPAPAVPPAAAVPPTTPAALPVPPAAISLSFDVMGVHTGMSQSDVMFALDQEMSGELSSEFMLTPAQFNGDDVLNMAIATNPASWPSPGSEQVLSVFDESAPEQGALAVFRTVILPDSITQSVFSSQVLPDLVAKYGDAGRVGDGLTWVGDATAREAILSGAMAPAQCGALRAILPSPATPEASLALDPTSLDSIQSGCGQVLQVQYTPGALNIGLWDSSAIQARRAAMGGGGLGNAPLIKF